MRLIDADALIEHIKDVPTWWMNEQVGFLARKYPDGLYDPNDVISSIDSAPTIEARPVVRARWVDLGRNYYTVVSQCSECGAKYDFRSPYCPNCGAEMRTKEGE